MFSTSFIFTLPLFNHFHLHPKILNLPSLHPLQIYSFTTDFIALVIIWINPSFSRKTLHYLLFIHRLYPSNGIINFINYDNSLPIAFVELNAIFELTDFIINTDRIIPQAAGPFLR